MSNYPAIDFLFLSEEDMIKAGVLDADRCIETMRDTLSLFGKKIFFWEDQRQMNMDFK